MQVQNGQLPLQIMACINFVHSICIYFKYCDLSAPLSAFHFFRFAFVGVGTLSFLLVLSVVEAKHTYLLLLQ